MSADRRKRGLEREQQPRSMRLQGKFDEVQRIASEDEQRIADAARRRSEGATREQEATERAYVAEVDRRSAHAQRAVDELRAALEHVDGDTFKDLDRIRRTLRRIVDRNTWQRKTWRH